MGRSAAESSEGEHRPHVDSWLAAIASESDGSLESELRVAKAMVDTGRLTQAIGRLARLVRRCPWDGRARVLLASAYLHDLEIASAREHLDVALEERQPPNVRKAAELVLTQIETTAGPESAEAVSHLLERRSAALFEQSGSADDEVARAAIERLDALRARYPASMRVKAHRAMAMSLRRRTEEALEDVDELMSAAAGDGALLWNLGEMLSICGRTELASDAYRSAHALEQDGSTRTQIRMRMVRAAIASEAKRRSAEASADDRPHPQADGRVHARSPGEEVFGEFTVEQELGRGGMGRVYSVRDRKGGRFAVEIATCSDDLARARLLDEIQTLAQLPPHPHLSPLRFFRSGGSEVGVFSDIAETNLEEAVRSGALDDEATIDLLIQAAWGLAAAHACACIHTDVRPSIVLISEDGTALVSEFGLSQALVDRVRGLFDLAARGSAGSRGTQASRSPEQARGEPLTSFTDVWSFGVMVLSVLRGESTRLSGVAAATVLDELALDIRGSRLPLSDEFRAVLRNCLREVPGERPSMEDVAAALVEEYRRVSGGAYPRARPPVTEPATTRVPDPASAGPGQAAPDRTGWRQPAQWLRELGASEAACRLEREGVADFIATGGAVAGLLAGYEEAAAECRRQIAEGALDRHLSLGGILHDRGILLRRADDTSGAIESFESSERAFAQAPNSIASARGSGRAAAARALLLGNTGGIDASRRAYDSAIPLLRRALSAQPDDEPVRFELAGALGSRASIHRADGEAVQAIGMVDEMLAVLPLEDAAPDVRLNGVVALSIPLTLRLAAGDAVRALAVADKIVELVERSVLKDKLVGPEPVSRLLMAYDARIHVLRVLGRSGDVFETLARKVEAMALLATESGQPQALAREMEEIGNRLVEVGGSVRAMQGATRLARAVVDGLRRGPQPSSQDAAGRLERQLGALGVDMGAVTGGRTKDVTRHDRSKNGLVAWLTSCLSRWRRGSGEAVRSSPPPRET